MKEKAKPFPKGLRILKVIFWLGLLAGVLVVITGFLGLVLNFMSSVFEDDPVMEYNNLLWFAGYGLLETIVSFRVVRLLSLRSTSAPAKIIAWVWWFTILQLLLSAIRFLIRDNYSSEIMSFAKEWLFLAFFYFYVSSMLRFMDQVSDYYGKCAPHSKFSMVNCYGLKFVKFMRRA